MKLHVAAVLIMSINAAALPAQTARDSHGDALPTGAFARLGMLRFQHDAEGICTALAVFPDGKHVVSERVKVQPGKSGLAQRWRHEGREH